MDIFFTNRDELTKVNLQHVMYIKADGNYCEVCLKSGRIITLLSSLHNIQQLLESCCPKTFVMIGRSHILNIHYISQINLVHKSITVADDNTKEHEILYVSKESVMRIVDIMKKNTGTTIETFKTKNGHLRASFVNNS